MTATYRRVRRPQYVAALSGLSVLLLGCGGSPTAAPSSDGPSTSSKVPVTPSVSQQPSTAAPVTSPFADSSLRSYLAQRQGEITAAVFDARTGKIWTLNPGSVQRTASIVKVQIMGTALRQAELAGHPLPAAESSLIPPMIEASSNDAATALLADVGGPAAVARFDRSIGMTQTTPTPTQPYVPGTGNLPGWGLTTTTAVDEVRLVSRFAFPNAFLNSRSRSYGLGLMEHIDPAQAWGITAGVPAGAIVALKNGWVAIPWPNGPWQVDSIGWVSGHGRNYVLAVLTKGSPGPTEAYGVATIETIARSVYRQLGAG